MMTIVCDGREISKVMIRTLRKNSHFTLHVITKYNLPEEATKDIYYIYDISKLDQFANDLESGELVNYKKLAINGIILFH